MKLNVSLKEFKKKHNQKKNQVLYYKIKSKSSFEIENLINNLNDTYMALRFKDEEVLPIELEQRKKLKYRK